MRRRDALLATAVAAAIVAAVGYATGQWRSGALLGSSAGGVLAFLEHLRAERGRLMRR